MNEGSPNHYKMWYIVINHVSMVLMLNSGLLALLIKLLGIQPINFHLSVITVVNLRDRTDAARIVKTNC
jgi:hypothetical protein